MRLNIWQIFKFSHQDTSFYNLLCLSAEVDEEDSCPPDLEAVELQQQQQQQQLQLQQQQQQYHQQQQQAVEAQRPPVQQEQQPVQNLELNLSGLDSDLVRNLAIAIKVRDFWKLNAEKRLKFFYYVHKF